MSLEIFIETYGYPALLIGTFFEGETFLILAGFAAHQGYLDIPWVILAAFIGTLSGDLVFFYLGRRHSALVQSILDDHPHWLNRVARVQRLIEKYETLLAFLYHFLYGLRIAFLLVIGLSRIPAGKFLLLNLFSALVWAVALGLAGYLFGSALGIIIGDLKGLESYVLGGIAMTGGLFAIFQLLGWRWMKNKGPKKRIAR
jgi:membrane protein DedA with SNARE-associated domain